MTVITVSLVGNHLVLMFMSSKKWKVHHKVTKPKSKETPSILVSTDKKVLIGIPTRNKPKNTGGIDPRENFENEIWDIEAGL